ncbi:uncharacterized protein LOC141673201 [Apium graveolens]|uniref:uncharacterized protein LOC141673201 n=1 Tax=Apium graveolens TaxID=4045 RepID=UPI003D78CE22
MNLLSWNCRGLGNPRTVRVLGDVIRSLKPTFLFLSETKVDKGRIDELCSKYGFSDCFAVNRIGQGGGLAVMWKENQKTRVVRPVKELSNKGLDTLGGNPHPQSLLDGFRLAVEDCHLVELDFTGGEFTWEKSKGKPNWFKERLDRAFANQDWWRKFPLCTLNVNHVLCSDHDHIQLLLCDMNVSKKQFIFHFENSWLQEPSFKEEVTGFWKSLPTVIVLPKLLSTSSFMAKWGKNFFHKFRDKVKKQKEIMNALECREDAEGIKSYFEEKERLNELLLNEEVYWKQRAKTFWLKEGDLNTKFFHAQASKRKKLNNVAF